MKQIVPLFLLLLVAGTGLMAQDTTHKEIIGKYKFPAGSVVDEVVVTQENGAFTMTSSVGASPLELIKGDTFNIVSFNGFAVFKRDDAKKINGVHIEASGYVLDGTREGITISITVTKAKAYVLPADDTLALAERLQLTENFIEHNLTYKVSGCIIP